MKPFPNNPVARTIATLLIALLCLRANAEAPQPVKLAPIPQMTLVEVRYSGEKEPGGQPAETAAPNAVIAKGRQSRVKSQSWPDNQVTCDVRINGWRFFNDPSARSQYRDYVQIIELTKDDEGQADFPELQFINPQAIITEGKFRGKPVWLVTSAPSPPKFNDQAIANLLERIGNGPDRKEVESNLREAQRLEAKRASEPADCAWVDPATRLPLAARIDGLLVTYSYKPIDQMPSLPANIQNAIREKFGQIPQF